MCFSPAASFAASLSLGTAGVANLRQIRQRREWPLALVPLLLGFQQLLEGLVWLSFKAPLVNLVASKIFVFFAYALWPAYIPWAVLLVEPSATRKKFLWPLTVAGFFIGLYGFWNIAFYPTPVAVVCRSIGYVVPVLIPLFGLGYVFVCSVACLISSYRWINLLGLAVFGSFIMAFTFFYQTGTSVWCFFAALLSFFIYFHFRSLRLKK